MMTLYTFLNLYSSPEASLKAQWPAARERPFRRALFKGHTTCRPKANRTLVRISSLFWITTLLCGTLALTAVQAQAQDGGVRGQVVDEAKTGIAFATVALLRLPDSTYMAGAQTRENGRFSITGVAAGSYVLKISYVGYLPYRQGQISVQAGHTENLGVVTLARNTRLLDEVLVKTKVPDVQYDLDKTTFNITEDIRSMSTNASQILEQIPMVELDEEGVPSVMGQGVTVLIDGRPSRIYGSNIETVLKLIPAGTIDKVEVITNPSARYTTEEGGIVLNIITKNEHLVGLSGIASVGGNTNGNYSPSLSLNLNTPKFAWNNSISYDFDRDPFHSSLLRENLADTLFFTDQTRTGTDNDRDFSYDGHLSYQLSEKNRLGVFFGLGHATEREHEVLQTRTLANDKTLLSAYTRDITNRENNWQYRAGVHYEKTFARKEQVLEAEAYYSTRRDRDHQDFDQRSDWDDLNALERQNERSHDKGFTFKTDYVHPFSEKSRLEAGVRADWETDDNDFIPEYFDKTADDYLVVDSLLNDYATREQEFEGYAMYRTEIHSFSLQAGARLEKAILRTRQHILNQYFDNEFLNLIPTLNLSYRLKNNDNLSFSYSRRANRPWWRQLSPFVDYTDPENIRTGNPDLKPEFHNAFELRYGKFINQFSLFGSLFYRHSHHPIQAISTVDANGVSYTSYENKGSENYYGLETGVSADIVKDWNVRLNLGLRKNEVLGFEEAYEAVGFNGRFSTFFPLPMGIRGYAYLRYHGPRAIAQGTRRGSLMGDVGLRRNFMGERGQVSLRLSDVFNQRRHDQDRTTATFKETRRYQRQSRYLALNVSFLFGKLEGKTNDHGDKAAPDNGMEQDSGEGDDF